MIKHEIVSVIPFIGMMQKNNSGNKGPIWVRLLEMAIGMAVTATIMAYKMEVKIEGMKEVAASRHQMLIQEMERINMKLGQLDQRLYEINKSDAK